MNLALPAAPAPQPRRQLLVGTALACVAGTMLIGGMSAVWWLMRDRVVDAGERFPANFVIPEVATNVMLITLGGLCLFAQWAVYAARQRDRVNVALALGVVAVMGVAFINGQAFVWFKIGAPIAEGTYGAMFYALTGTMVALVVAGLVYTAVAAFRFLGGRSDEQELVAAHALYWYFVAAAFAVVWFVVYVTK